MVYRRGRAESGLTMSDFFQAYLEPALVSEGAAATGAEAVKWLVASHGAEDLLAGLALAGQVHVSVSCDSDLVGLGAALVLDLQLAESSFKAFSMVKAKAQGRLPNGPWRPILAGLSSDDYMLIPDYVKAEKELYSCIHHGSDAFGMDVLTRFISATNDAAGEEPDVRHLDLEILRSVMHEALRSRLPPDVVHRGDAGWLKAYAEALVASCAFYVHAPVPFRGADRRGVVSVVPLDEWVLLERGEVPPPRAAEVSRWWATYVDLSTEGFQQLLSRQSKLEVGSPAAKVLEVLCCSPESLTLHEDASRRVATPPRARIFYPRTGFVIPVGTYGPWVWTFVWAVRGGVAHDCITVPRRLKVSGGRLVCPVRHGHGGPFLAP